MIIDPRGRIGGGAGYPDISDPRLPRLTVTGRDFARTGPDSFRRPTLWPSDGGTRSGAKLLAHTLKHKGYGPLVGANTAGAPFLLPDGGLLYAAVAGLAIDGRRLEGVGFPPDIAVSFPPPYAAGADPQPRRAIEEAPRLVP